MTAAIIYGTLSALAFFGLGFLTGNSVGYRDGYHSGMSRYAAGLERLKELTR